MIFSLQSGKSLSQRDPEPQSGDAGDPTLCQGAAPTDHPRISGHDKAFRTDHKSFSTQYLNFQRGFYSLYRCVPMPGASRDSNRFLHGADWAWDFFLPHTKKCSWNKCICRKGVFISNNWHFVMTVALAKSSWPSLIFIENFIECFFAFGLCFILSPAHTRL